ncbi:hypothetical protein MetMK1DRAFT_00007050 [Metallosphaera yellowstonensis MK1]|uniref:Uncharacterized protein n=1 Tax=Metallosphaera yellowstonensis MK1 TaxID=671065 RepID=H2C1T2_9CREN|nr:hypothetical protein MetMK1DRAFT_00007050 [Metallosphaera yellowstonensis MK1]
MVTALVLEVVGEDAPLNETAEEEERTSPRYARHMFLRGFRVSLRGVVYGLEWVTVRLHVLYRGGVAQGGGAGAQGPPLLHVGNAEL